MALILEPTQQTTRSLLIHYPPDRAFTDDELLELSSRNKDLQFERTAQGDLVVMTPTGGKSSSRNAEITFQLAKWAREDGTGVTFDSSGGFRLPSSAIRAPDACWVSSERLDKLTDEEMTKFPPLCPEFVIELRSASDGLRETQAKMQEYRENGAKLGWLIDPEEKKVHVYTSDGVEVLDNPEKVSGGELLVGFELDLTEVW